jgi:hypothetical protein
MGESEKESLKRSIGRCGSQKVKVLKKGLKVVK